jgi:SAM-dependent methyltransferase
MNQEFWDKRYRNETYAYGTEPNDFLKSCLEIIKPNSYVLCLAEGEGRNAVFLAQNGHSVTAIDYSEEGIKKLNKLAKEKNLVINTLCEDLSSYTIEYEKWDTIICIFGHFPESVRSHVFNQIYSGLKENGKFILEGYHKNQLKYKTGGPQSLDLLYDPKDLLNDLNRFENLQLNCVTREIHEGEFHKGPSSVIQIIAIK